MAQEQRYEFEDGVICGPRNVRVGSNPHLVRRRLAVESFFPDEESRELIRELLSLANSAEAMRGALEKQKELNDELEKTAWGFGDGHLDLRDKIVAQNVLLGIVLAAHPSKE